MYCTSRIKRTQVHEQFLLNPITFLQDLVTVLLLSMLCSGDTGNHERCLTFMI